MKLAQTIAGMFLQTSATRGQQIAQTALDGQWHECGRAAHGLRALAGNVGAVAVQQLSEQIEDAVNAGDTDKTAALAAQMPGEIATALQMLNDWFAANGA